MHRIRASFQRVGHNAGPIAVLGMFLLLGIVVFLLLRGNEQGRQIVRLQQAQAESSKNGRAILEQVAALTKQTNAFSDPNSDIQKAQQAKVAGYLQSLTTAQQTLNADQLRKLGEMAIALGASRTTVNRILSEPVPVITFGAPARPQSPPLASSPVSPAAPATRTGGTSSTVATSAVQACRGPVALQATPLTLPLLPPTQIQVCISP